MLKVDHDKIMKAAHIDETRIQGIRLFVFFFLKKKK
jgi:hypothetical protein